MNQTPTSIDPANPDPAAQDTSLRAETVSIAKNAGYGVIGIIFSQLIAYITSAILTRYLGASDYGIFVLVTQFVTLLGFMAALGLPQGGIRYLSHYAGQGNIASMKGTLIYNLRLIITVSLSMALVLAIFSHDIAGIYGQPRAGTYLRILALYLPVSSLLVYTVASLIGLKLISWQVVLEYFFKPITWLVMLIILATTQLGLRGVTWAFVLLTLLMMILGLSVIYRKFFRIHASVKPTLEAKALHAFATPLYINELVAHAIQFIPLYFLGIWAGSTQVGIYNICFKLSLLVGLLSTSAFVKIFGPVISSHYARREYAAVAVLLKTTSKWIFSISISIFLVLLHFSVTILGFFGDEFRAGSMALIVILIGQVANASSGPLANVLMMSGRPRIVMLNALFQFGITLVLAYLLVKPHGLMGAVMAMSIALILMPIIKLIQVYHFERMHPFSIKHLKHLIAIIIAFTGMYFINHVICLPPRWLLLLGSTVYGFLFVLSLLLLKPDEEDGLILRKTLHKLHLRRQN